MISFVKYHGTGNDFILIDDRESKLGIDENWIRSVCDRHRGIGADGLIIIRNHKEYDFDMLYFNSDGLPGSMCGNGGRCAVSYAHSLGIVGSKARFNAFDGFHDSEILATNPYLIKLHMNDVTQFENGPSFIFMDTGSPHYIRFIENVSSLDLINEARKVRYNERFKSAGTNVNFVEMKDEVLFVRTYERGVEDETLSCGTGVTASVLAAALSGRVKSNHCSVITPGGSLVVHFKREGNIFRDIWLEGPAQMVYKGVIDHMIF